MALRIFDPTTMDYREANQVDIEELCLVRAAYGRIMARFQEDRAQLLAEIKGLRSRSGMPNDLMVDGIVPVEPEDDDAVVDRE